MNQDRSTALIYPDARMKGAITPIPSPSNRLHRSSPKRHTDDERLKSAPSWSPSWALRARPN